MLNHLRRLCLGLSGSVLLLGLGQGLASPSSLAAETIYPQVWWVWSVHFRG